MKKLILTSVVIAGLFTACGNKTEETKHEATTEVKHESKSVMDKVIAHKDEIKTEAKEVIAKVEAKTEEIKTEAKEVIANVATKTEEVKTEAKAVIAKVTTKTEEVKTEAIAKVETKTAISGEKLYNQCSSCHGINAEKKALNNSEIIKSWDAAKIETALNGYKDGSYGGSMKGIMKGQVSKLDSDKIKALAKYISSL